MAPARCSLTKRKPVAQFYFLRVKRFSGAAAWVFAPDNFSTENFL
jgi:hypothetical protein